MTFGEKMNDKKHTTYCSDIAKKFQCSRHLFSCRGRGEGSPGDKGEHLIARVQQSVCIQTLNTCHLLQKLCSCANQNHFSVNLYIRVH